MSKNDVIILIMSAITVISILVFLEEAKPFSLIMLWLGSIIALISCAVNVLVQARRLSSINGEDYLKAASIIALVLMGAGLLFFQMPFQINIEFPADLPAVFAIPPHYSPLWLPVVDGVILDGETVKALGLALAGTCLGLLMAKRYVRPLSIAFSALVLWNLKFIVEVQPGDHELIRPYILIALLLALALLSLQTLRRQKGGSP